jgi:hypothetical protein
VGCGHACTIHTLVKLKNACIDDCIEGALISHRQRHVVYSAASQGRCCSCNLADQLQLGSSDEAVRGGLSCSLGGTGQASAHCLRFDTLWYNVYVAPLCWRRHKCECTPPTLSITQFTLAFMCNSTSCTHSLVLTVLNSPLSCTHHPLARTVHTHHLAHTVVCSLCTLNHFQRITRYEIEAPLVSSRIQAHLFHPLDASSNGTRVDPNVCLGVQRLDSWECFETVTMDQQRFSTSSDGQVRQVNASHRTSSNTLTKHLHQAYGGGCP